MSRLGEIILIAGPNGAGKTTFVKNYLPAHANFTYVNADEIAKRLAASGVPNSQLDMRAGREALNRIRQSILFGEDIIIETTLSGTGWAKHTPTWRSCGYEVLLYYIRLSSPETAIKRVKQRVADGGHDIPEPIIRRRFERSLLNLESVYKTVVDQWYVFDSRDDGSVVLAASWRP